MGRLTYEDRLRIKEMALRHMSAPAIAKELGCSHSAIYDEFERGGGRSSMILTFRRQKLNRTV